jgi:zinc and cadmium transporter
VTTFAWIVLSGILMSVIALVGSVTLLLRPETLRRMLRPLVAFAAGTLLGGALLHMLPTAVEEAGPCPDVFLAVLGGFALFFAVEQFLHWHRSHRGTADGPRPLTYLILIGDALHNLIGGLGVAAAFIADTRAGIGAWLAAAAHEVPQELGDFGVLVHGGWPRGRALLFNALSALTFLIGSLLAYLASFQFDVTLLLPFAAGNFLYIAASDLIPEVKRGVSPGANLVNFAALSAGIMVLYAIRILLG